MNHIVYLDSKAKELEKIIDGSKTMIIRGANGRKIPYGRVYAGDNLYFIENNASGIISAKATVKNVINSEKMTEAESFDFVNRNQEKLLLTEAQLKRWAGKRYLVLIEVKNIVEIEPIIFVKSNYGTMDDWLSLENIHNLQSS